MARTKTISDTELLATAREVFVERGFGASTREIARRAGISEGVLFQRYATKRELFFAAMVLPAPDPMARLKPAAVHGFEQLVGLAEGITDYFRQTVPVLLPLMSHPGFRFEEFARRHPNSPLDELRRRLVGFFAEERRSGRISEVDPGAAALMVLGVAQTIAFFERMGAHGGHFPPELLRRGLLCLWDGLAPRPPAGTARARKR
jgi:AcrR family transcriptional regulator